MGVYVCEERVVRGGYLVAFEGEVMTDEEAAARGLPPKKPQASEKKREQPRKSEPTKADLMAEAMSLGIDVPVKATKEQLAKLIAQARGDDESAEDADEQAADEPGKDADGKDA